ncbi:MAG: Holliday junction branch migration DNA helicase RuvB [Epsilonproteobacteria bacterium]|nr:MAG: Holliday junction branch migration DNA helicase RuvB [Campylobacterota bacterium]
MEKEFILSPRIQDGESSGDKLLRPKDFTEFIGQQRIVDNVDIMIKSAKLRNHSMDHALLSGPPGLGKTSLAMIIARAMGSEVHVLSGPALEKKGDLAAILTNLNPKDVLFIDEIHRIPIAVEEILYSAMEDYKLDILIGQGPTARNIEIKLNPFTLLGATTRPGLLSNPLRDRFMADLHFDFYAKEDIAQIISNNSSKLDISLNDEATLKLAMCSRGTPRIANRILRRVRDVTIVSGKTKVSELEIQETLKLMEIDIHGLNRMDRKILTVIKEYYNGGPVGIEALISTLGEEKGTIEDVHEPYLLKEGYLLRTSRGREISDKTWEILGGRKNQLDF